MPLEVIEAMAEPVRRGISNTGGSFVTSDEAGSLMREARVAVADYFNAASADEVVFGQSMTNLTFAMSRALATEWNESDEIIVTDLDHDANITPWRRAADERGVTVKTISFDPDSGALDMGQLETALTDRTRLVAVTCASNAVGSVTPMEGIVTMAHDAGALVYADAVHYSAHRRLESARLGVDFVAASAYKFYGPHTGVLVARREHLERLPAYKVVPAPDTGPGKWETGTPAFEAIAGITAAIDYLASLGDGDDRRARLDSAFSCIQAHEDLLSARFLAGVAEMPWITTHGVTTDGPGDRVSTFAITVDGATPSEVAKKFGESGIYVWDGHYYAVAAMRRLGLLDSGGAVRIGFVHYTTEGEVDRALHLLDDFGRG